MFTDCDANQDDIDTNDSQMERFHVEIIAGSKAGDLLPRIIYHDEHLGFEKI